MFFIHTWKLSVPSHLTLGAVNSWVPGGGLPHMRPLSTEPGLQKRKAFSVSRELLSATTISEASWKEYMGSLFKVFFRRLVMVSKVLMSRC